MAPDRMPRTVAPRTIVPHTIAHAWAEGRNHFNLIRLVAAWMVIYGHAWAITGAPGNDLVAQYTQYKFAGGVAVDMFFVIAASSSPRACSATPCRATLPRARCASCRR